MSAGAMQGQVVISEVDAFGHHQDQLGRGEDWIELHNAGPSAVYLGGLFLSDDPDEWTKWALPQWNLAPGERRIVFASGRDVGQVHHWECPASAESEWRYLAPQGALFQDWRTIGFDDGEWPTGMGSIGYGDGDDATEVEADVVFMRKTFSVADPEELIHGWLAVDYDDGYVAFLNGREVARSASMGDQGVAHDVYALTGHEAMLYQGGIPDAVPFDPREWLVPGVNVLAVQVHNVEPGSSDLTCRPFLALGRSGPASVPFGPMPSWWVPDAPEAHANFKLRPGEPVILSDSQGNLVDLATLPLELRGGLSMGRNDQGEWRFFEGATPGLPNGMGDGIHIAPTPVVEPASGWYDAVQVTAVNGALSTIPAPSLPPLVLRYTTDGSEPTEDSPVLTGTWTPQETTVLSIRAFGEGVLPSATVDRTYLIGDPASNLQTVSIITHPDHLWDWQTGIYVMGPNAGADYPHLGANFWQPWSRESRLEWFDAEGDPVARGRFDLEIHGGWSRAEPQRSFRLDFKPRYTGPLDHIVFPSRPYLDRVRNLNLRNGGQASWETKFQDAFIAELALNTHVVASAWRPVEVFLNGEYWGVYGAREKTDEQFVEDHYGWDENGVDMLNQWVNLNGAPSAFEATVDPLLGLADGSAAFHSAFLDQFDLQSFLDYHIFEIHGQNVDWITAPWGLKNIKYFRSTRGDGLWRPILFDLDACFGAWGTPPSENYLNLTLNPPTPSRFSHLFAKVLADPEFACGFATRTCDLMASIFDPVRFDARLDMTAAVMSGAMARHIDRWASPASMEYWMWRLDLMKEHNAQRVSYTRNQVGAHYGFGGAELLTVTWTPPFSGRVEVNGMDDLANGWSGHYFGECPIRIAAFPGPGQGFLGWTDNLHTNLGVVDPTQPFLEVGMQGDDTFQAMFGPCMEGLEWEVVPDVSGLHAVGPVGPYSLTWFLEGQPMAAGADVALDQEGAYTLTVSDGSCTLVLGPVQWPGESSGEPSGIASAPEEGGLLVSPNPTSGRARVEGPSGVGDLEVWGPQGQRVMDVRKVELPWELQGQGWTAGPYLVRFTRGEVQWTTRLVVQ